MLEKNLKDTYTSFFYSTYSGNLYSIQCFMLWKNIKLKLVQKINYSPLQALPDTFRDLQDISGKCQTYFYPKNPPFFREITWNLAFWWICAISRNFLLQKLNSLIFYSKKWKFYVKLHDILAFLGKLCNFTEFLLKN